MGLVDKLKNAGKALALAGGLGGMAYNSGCTPLAIVGGAALIAQSNRDAAEREAQSRENAARMQAQGGNSRNWQGQNQNYNQNGVKMASIYDAPILVFHTCTFKENSPGNGFIDLSDMDFTIDNKKVLKKSERVGFYLHFNNKNGSTFNFIIRNKKNLENVEEDRITIPYHDSVTYGCLFWQGTPLKSRTRIQMREILPLELGDYIATVEMDNEIIGIKEIRITD